MEKELAHSHVSIGYRILMSKIRTRAAKRNLQVIEILSRSIENGQKSPLSKVKRPLLRIRSHFGASLTYDAYFEAEQLRLQHQRMTLDTSEANDNLASGLETQSPGFDIQSEHDALSFGSDAGAGITTSQRDALNTMNEDFAARASMLPLELRGWGFAPVIWENAVYEDSTMYLTSQTEAHSRVPEIMDSDVGPDGLGLWSTWN